MVSAKTKSLALLGAGVIGGGVAALAGIPEVSAGIVGAGILGFIPYHAIAQDEAAMKAARKIKKLKEAV